jgi:hypothetical protein
MIMIRSDKVKRDRIPNRRRRTDIENERVVTTCVLRVGGREEAIWDEMERGELEFFLFYQTVTLRIAPPNPNR